MRLAAREWMEYQVDVEATGTYDVAARVAAPSAGGAFRLEVDGEDVTGPIPVDATGGWEEWATVTYEGLDLTAGPHVLRVYVTNDGFNLNKLTFSAATGTAVEGEEVPRGARLLPNHPNPFRGGTTLAYELPRAEAVTLEVYDAAGRRVAVPVQGVRPPGRHAVRFDGAGLPSGVYFVRLVTPGRQQLRTLLLLR